MNRIAFGVQYLFLFFYIVFVLLGILINTPALFPVALDSGNASSGEVRLEIVQPLLHYRFTMWTLLQVVSIVSQDISYFDDIRSIFH